MTMNPKSHDLLLYLRQKRSISCSTIQLLIKYGFDSNDSLMALNFDLDFPQMTDISFGQKLILKKILNDFKSLINNSIVNNDCISDDNCAESQLLIEEFKALFQQNIDSNKDQLIISNEELEKQLKKTEKIIQKLENESKLEEIKRNKLEIELNDLKKNIEKLGNEFKRYVFIDKKGLKELKTLLKSKYESNINQNSRVIENKTLGIDLDEISSESQLNGSVSEEAKSVANIGSKIATKSIRKWRSRDLKCDYNECVLSFVTISGLRMHINSVHKKVKPFECDYKGCGKKFTRNFCFKEHINRHLGYKPYKCDYNECVSSFVTISGLRKHINSVHDKVKPFQCDYNGCGKKFTRNFCFKEHINRHLGYKPYKCDYNDCDLVFINPSLLKRHICVKHTKEKKFKCNHNKCYYSCVTSAHLKKHIQLQHTK